MEDRLAVEIGQIEAIFRYPVKSMRGEQLAAATMGWHGLEGDRRLAFGRLDHRGGFPWITASRVPELLLFTPQTPDEKDGEGLPTHVLTPDGRTMPVFGDSLAAEIGERCGAPVKMMRLR